MSEVRKKIKHWLWWAVLLLAVVFLARAVYSEFSRYRGLEGELTESEQEVERISANILDLKEEIEGASDEQRLEKEARRTLNLKREGEEVFVVVGVDDISGPEDFSTVFDNSFEEESGVWLNIKKWWGYFFK